MYLAARFAEDPHVFATTLYDEIVDLGFDRSYPTFTRLVRVRTLRPARPYVLPDEAKVSLARLGPAGTLFAPSWGAERPTDESRRRQPGAEGSL